jgi:hypothetical protein
MALAEAGTFRSICVMWTDYPPQCPGNRALTRIGEKGRARGGHGQDRGGDADGIHEFEHRVRAPGGQLTTTGSHLARLHWSH